MIWDLTHTKLWERLSFISSQRLNLVKGEILQKQFFKTTIQAH